MGDDGWLQFFSKTEDLEQGLTRNEYKNYLGTIKKLCNPLMGRGEVLKRLHKSTRGRGNTQKDYI